MTRSEGFALVLVLWVLSLLTIMAGSFALSMRREAAIV
ncbi:MAG: type II secretion system protein GspK, partial [Methylobacter sp.]